jgi:site-specific DNA recombinase
MRGFAVCATYDGGMTLRTGTSRSGQVHKYYTCSTCARMGKSVCRGRSLPMAKLDTLVVDHLIDRLFQPERLRARLRACERSCT